MFDRISSLDFITKKENIIITAPPVWAKVV
jgi:hypothetical protein